MPESKLWCTVSGQYITTSEQVNIEGTGQINIGITPCPNCRKHIKSVDAQSVEDNLSRTLAGTVDARIIVTGNLTARTGFRDEQPNTPPEVKVRDIVILSCSPEIW